MGRESIYPLRGVFYSTDRASWQAMNSKGTEKTRVLFLDQHHLFVNGSRAQLEEHDDIEVVGICSSAETAIEAIKGAKPHILIMDSSIPGLDGPGFVQQLREIDSGTQVIVFTMSSNVEMMMRLLVSGISAYVLKRNPLAELLLAIKVVLTGGMYFSREAFHSLDRHIKFLSNRSKEGFDLLSIRERDVFQLLAEGFPIKKIAEILCVSPKTVETHKYRIMRKLEISSLAELTKEAIRQGVIQL